MIVNFNEIIGRLASAILSWLDASNLRNRLYEQKNRIEILEIALEDIQRINNKKNILIDQIVNNTRNKK